MAWIEAIGLVASRDTFYWWMPYRGDGGTDTSQLALRIERERRDRAIEQALSKEEQELQLGEFRDRIPPGYTKNDWPIVRRKLLDALAQRPCKQFR